MKVADYKELRVCNLVFVSAMQIFRLSRQGPTEEEFSLRDQILRSSRSVCANSVEAWRKRCYQAAFVNKLSDSDANAAEAEVHLAIALSCNCLSEEDHAVLADRYGSICAQLTKTMSDASSWCESNSVLREVPPEYLLPGASAINEHLCYTAPKVPAACRAPDAPHAPHVPYAQRSTPLRFHTPDSHAQSHH